MREWKPYRIDTIVKHRLLEVQKHHVRADDEERDALIFSSVDWVNIVPVRDDRTVLLIKQWRYGITTFSLEIPGGLVDPGESHRDAAARELVEETGHRAATIERLAEISPNPALFDNTISFWLATDLEQVHDAPKGDGAEELELVEVPLDDIPRMALEGKLAHALNLVAFYFLGLRDR